MAARFWGEAPVQQARGSFRKFILDHQLDVADAALSRRETFHAASHLGLAST